MHHLVRYLVAMSLLIAAAVPTCAAQTFPFPKHSVVPVLFVPRDWDINSAEVQADAAALRSALEEIRQFYAHHLGGNTFILNDLSVVQGDSLKEAYGIHWNGGNIYTDGVTLDPSFPIELEREMENRGFPAHPYRAESGYVILTLVKGAGGFAGSYGDGVGENDGGDSMLGDWAIDSIAGKVPEGAYWWSGRRQQIGAVAHELGHGLSLPHPDFWGLPDNGMIMGAWWDYPNVGFSDQDNNKLAQARSRYFTGCSPPDPLEPAPAVKPYELVILPTLGSNTHALHINQHGWISGFSGTNSSTAHQVVFDDTLKLFDLGTAGGPHAMATSINDNGVVVGFWELPAGARRATFSIFDTVVKQWTTRELKVPPNADGPVAAEVDNLGTIVGGTTEFSGQATVWSGDSVTVSSLGSQSLAQSINNHRQIVGRVVTDKGQRAFLWTDSNGNGSAEPQEWIDLGVANTLPSAYTEAFSISDQGLITGSLYDGGIKRRTAFSLAPQNGNYVIDAGNGTNALIKVLRRLGRGLDYAIDANNQGVVVGRSGVCSGLFDVHAAIWQNDKVQDLNDLVAPQAGVTLRSAESINDAGEIVGWAATADGERGFLLRPIVPPPPQTASASVAQGNSIVLTWQDRSHNESGFVIERREGAAAGPEEGWSNLITVAPNTITYTDANLRTGTTYQYRIHAFNDNGSSSFETWPAVPIKPNLAPVAVADSYSLREDKTLVVAATAGLLANDRDPERDALTVTQVRAGPSHGQIQWAADGSFTYTPEHNYAGIDRFEYVVRDMVNNEASAEVTLTVINRPDRPHAHHDTYRTIKNTKLCAKAPGVLGNDNDGDHDKLHAVLKYGPHHGHLDLEKNGSFCYRPDKDFHGEDHFRYYAVDPSGRKDDAKVTIHVAKSWD